jgi:ribosomal protein S18 acetylase RimI-like enzyme
VFEMQAVAGPTERGDLRVGTLPPAQFGAAAALIARGTRYSPVLAAAFGPEPRRRAMIHRRLVTSYMGDNHQIEPIGVWRGDTLVACAAVALRGSCRHTLARSLRSLPELEVIGPRTAARAADWLAVWQEAHPYEPHAHLAPIAVDLHLQGRGMGTVLMGEHSRRLDEDQMAGYLETDSRESVRFFERFGYEVVGEQTALGVPCWYMSREPA